MSVSSPDPTDLVVVGSVAYDSIETAHGKRDNALGGSATFFSVAAARVTRPAVVAVIGDDFAESDVEVLTSRGIDVSGLVRAEGRTFRWGGKYHDDMNGRDTLFTELNVFENFRPVLSEAQRSASVIFLGNIHPALQLEVLDQVRSPHFVAADTMNFWISGARDQLLAVLDRVDALFINDEEAFELTGERLIRPAALAIQAMGPELVVIKRGEHGALMVHDSDFFYTPAYPLEAVIDPTGAGDTFGGGFVGHLASTGDFSPANMRRAAVVGTLMASFCVEGFGLEELEKVTDERLRRRYESFVQLTAFEPVTI